MQSKMNQCLDGVAEEKDKLKVGALCLQVM